MRPLDAGRDFSDKVFYSACYAPTTSMYFDQMGDVRACCQNTGGLLGNIREQSIREVWESAGADRLRDALAARDFSVGCGFCKWQADEGGSSPFARGFDRFEVRSQHPTWPRQMEFSMTNSCNLQCVMCNGDWSSSIRAHREQRPPLPTVYHDAFFEELAEFLPHLERAVFLGGEPFLGKEPLRVMEMLTEIAPTVPVSVTTNATQWSPRIEQICDRLPISFVVSLDGITKDTYESIRVGADFDEVMGNIDRFIAIAHKKGTEVSIAHCLMRPNWHEFIDLLLFAETKELAAVGINSVVFPTHLSLYQMDEPDLTEVVSQMEFQDRGPATRLRRFRPVWQEQLTALQNRLHALRSDDGGTLDPWSVTVRSPSSGTTRSAEPAFLPVDADAIAELTGWGDGTPPYRFRCVDDRVFMDGREIHRPINDVDPQFAELVGVTPESMVGRPMSYVFDLLRARFGDDHSVGPAPSGRPNNVQVEFRENGVVRDQAQSLLLSDRGEILMLVAHRRAGDAVDR
jgi:MoaA/NifB/PqqE/SkfB family radical SAM enzyme